MHNTCQECYSEYKRITPLLKPQACLEEHTQYICGTCGRCICIEQTAHTNLQRWMFPFKTLAIAKRYLRTADVTMKQACGIYELSDEKGRISYKIFESDEAANEYLKKHKQKHCAQGSAVFRKERYQTFPHTQIRKLQKDEISQYVNEQKQEGKG